MYMIHQWHQRDHIDTLTLIGTPKKDRSWYTNKTMHQYTITRQLYTCAWTPKHKTFIYIHHYTITRQLRGYTKARQLHVHCTSIHQAEQLYMYTCICTSYTNQTINTHYVEFLWTYLKEIFSLPPSLPPSFYPSFSPSLLSLRHQSTSCEDSLTKVRQELQVAKSQVTQLTSDLERAKNENMVLRESERLWKGEREWKEKLRRVGREKKRDRERIEGGRRGSEEIKVRKGRERQAIFAFCNIHTYIYMYIIHVGLRWRKLL